MEGKLRNMTAIYLTQNGKMLMLYRIGSRVVSPSWCGIGGHFEKDELNDAKAAMFREMNEEIGLFEHDIENLKFKYITLRCKNGEIRQNYYFFAKLKEYVDENLSSNEGICKWFALDEISSLEMPFTAKYVIEHFCKEGYSTNTLYVGVTATDKVDFYDLPKS